MSDENKNIEDFFRKFSETYPSKITFNQAHWERMEAMLDKQMPVTSSGGGGSTLDNLSSAVALITLIVLAIGVIWNWTIQKPNADAELADVTAATIEVPADNAVNNAELQRMALTQETSGEVATNGSDRANSENLVNTSAVGHSVPKVDVPDGTQSAGPIEDLDSSIEGELQERPGPVAEISEQQQKETSAFEQATETGSEALQAQRLIGKERGRRESVGPIDPLMPEVSTSVPNRAVLPVVIAAEQPPVKAVATFPRIAVGLSLAPDLSSNQLGSYNRLGAEFGAIFEYRFHRRWSVEVGALSTRKRYKVAGYDYSPEEGFWEWATDGQVPHSIDANCHVVDIPINIRYRFLENEVSSFSAAVGLSSYLMLSEEYEYELSYGADSWGTGHENDHFFSVANLQVYYERKLGRFFAVEAAPFLKLPLSGYGHGNIKFHSLGMFLNVKRYFHWR